MKLLDNHEAAYEQGEDALDELQFSVEHSVLMHSLSFCGKIIPSSGAIPILQTVKIDVRGNQMLMTATDNGQSVLQVIEIDNISGVNGSFLFPGKEGIDLVKNLPVGKLTLSLQDRTLHVTYGKRGKATLKALESNEYPQLPQLNPAEILSVPLEVLQRAASAETFCSYNGQTPILSGIHVINLEGKLGFESTDRHRLFRYKSDVSIINTESFINAVVPGKNLKQAIDVFKNSDQIDVFMSNQYFVMRNNKIIYFARLMEGNYPKLNSILDIKTKKQISLNCTELEGALMRALALKIDNNRVLLGFDEANEYCLKATSENSEVNEYFADIEFDADLPNLRVNAKFLQEAISASKNAKTVNLGIVDNKSPIFIKLDNDSGLVQVINPLT